MPLVNIRFHKRVKFRRDVGRDAEPVRKARNCLVQEHPKPADRAQTPLPSGDQNWCLERDVNDVRNHGPVR